MTKYKLLKPIKNVEWKVGEVRETEEDCDGDTYIQVTRYLEIYAVQLALLEHAGFIEEEIIYDTNLTGGEQTSTNIPKRWRAEKYRGYYYLDENFGITYISDIWGAYDNARYEAGNYFQTTEQIEEFKKGVKALVV